MFGEEGFTAIIQSELGDKREPIYFEIGREGIGEDVRAGGGGVDGMEFYTVFITEIFATEGEPEPGLGIQVKIECAAPPGMPIGIVVGRVAGSVDRAVDAKAENGAGFGDGDQVILVDLVVADVASPDIVEVQFEIITGGIAILGDQVFVVLPAGGNATVVGGIGDPDHEPAFSEGEVRLDTGMGEGAVGEHVGHAIVAVAESVHHFIPDMGGPGAAGELYPGGRGVADV